MPAPPLHNIETGVARSADTAPDESSHRVGMRAPAGQPGRILGELDEGEDPALFASLLVDARQRVLDGELPLLTHADDRPRVSEEQRRAEKSQKHAALRASALKRYVFGVDTDRGRRIVKIAETATPGNRLLGIWSSVARREHFYQRRCLRMGLAACRSTGFLEWRSGPHLRRALQVQHAVPASTPLLETFFADQLDRFGPDALAPLARAMAQTHAAGFFHGDLKPFHAYVVLGDDGVVGDHGVLGGDGVQTSDGGPASYRLRWIDLARVAFHLTRRKRIINLYQCFRFVLPDDEAAQQRFMTEYCRAAGWYATHPEVPLGVVRRFLARKLVTHPNP